MQPTITGNSNQFGSIVQEMNKSKSKDQRLIYSLEQGKMNSRTRTNPGGGLVVSQTQVEMKKSQFNHH